MNQSNESKPQEPRTNGASDKRALETIRDLLLAPEQQALSDLRKRIEHGQFSAEQLSQILPDSIDKARESGEGLSRSLGPVIDGAITESIKRDPATLADAISPIMMPAIRRAVTQMISGMAESFNRTLEQSLSAQGLKWRFEALRTGRSFSEVAMLHSLIYRVEQVFLIHRETGLMLAHVADSDIGVIDADMVSGMLTAIQSFVRDSFSDGKQEFLNTMDCDQYDVLIEYGPKAILAAVVSGIAPSKLRQTLAETLDKIHVQHADSLREFIGDSEPFETTRSHLERCLVSQSQSAAQNPSRGWVGKYAWVLPIALLLGLLVWGGLRWHNSHRKQTFANLTRMPTTVDASYRSGRIQLTGAAHDDWIQEVADQATRFPWLKDLDVSALQNLDAKWIEFQNKLRHEPGLVITESTRIGDTFRLNGLRDPLATEPSALLAAAGLRPESIEMTWVPYQSLERPIVQRRIEQLLNPPTSVTLNWQDDKLIVTGSTTDDWWRAAEPRALASLGSDQLDASALQISNPAFNAFLDLLQREPGIVIASTEWHHGQFLVQGKRDKYAADPEEMLRQSDLDRDRVKLHCEPFVSDDPIIVKRRIRSELALPDSVTVLAENGKVQLGGSAEFAWIASLPQRIELCEDIGEIDFSRVIPSGFDQIAALTTSISNTVVYFSANSNTINDDELPKLQRAKQQIVQLQELAHSIDRVIHIKVVGRTATRQPQKNLSLERVRAVLREILSDSNLPHDIFEAGWTEKATTAPTEIQRGRVTFDVSATSK